MADKKIIEIQDKTTGGSSTRTSRGGTATPTVMPASFKRLEKTAKVLEDSTKDQKKLIQEQTKALTTTVEKVFDKQFKGQKRPEGLTAKQFKDAMKLAVAEALTPLIKKLGATPRGAIQKTGDPKTDKLLKGIEKSVEEGSKAGAKELSKIIGKKTGVQLDAQGIDKLSRAVSSAVMKAIPQSTGDAAKGASDLIKSSKEGWKAVGELTKNIQSLRKGGVETKEVAALSSNISTLAKELKNMAAATSGLLSSIKSMGDETKELKKELTSYSKAIDTKLKTVLAASKKDPVSAVKTVTSNIASRLPADPKFDKITRALEAVASKVEGVEDFKKEFKSGVREIKDAFKEVKTVAGLDAKSMAALDAADKSFTALSKVLVKTTTVTKVKVDDKDAKKKLKQLEQGTTIEAEVVIDDKKVDAKLKKLEAKVEKFKSAFATIGGPKNLKLEGAEGALDSIMKMKELVNDLDSKGLKKFSLQLNFLEIALADVAAAFHEKLSPPKQALDRLSSSLKRLDLPKIELDITADTSEAEKKVEEVKDKLSKDSISIDVKFNFEKEANKLLKGIEGRIADISKTPAVMGEPGKGLDTLKSLQGQKVMIEGLSSTAKTLTTSNKDNVKEQLKIIQDIFKDLTKMLSSGTIERPLPVSAAPAPAAAGGGRPPRDPRSTVQEPPRQPRKASPDIRAPRMFAPFEEKLIEPSQAGVNYPTAGLAYGKGVRENISKNVSELQKSLDDLQNYMVKEMEKALTESAKGWEIVREKGAKKADYFVQAAGTNLKESSQWKFQIANIGKMVAAITKQSTMAGVDVMSPAELSASSPKQIVETYIKRRTSEKAAFTPKGVHAEKIGEWLAKTPMEDVGSFALDKSTVDRLKKIKKTHKGTEAGEKLISAISARFDNESELIEVFKKTFAETMVKREMLQDVAGDPALLRNIALPAAKLGASGGASLRTLSGSKRGLSKFATFKTGYEEMYDRLSAPEAGMPTEFLAGTAKSIRTVTKTRPKSRVELENFSELSKTMMTALAAVGEEQVGFITEQYKKAGVMKGIERKSAGLGNIEEFSSKINDAVNNLKAEDFAAGQFIDKMQKAGVSAYDFAKSLDNVKFENIYDVYKKILEKPIKGVAEAPGWTKPIRTYERAIHQLEQLMPLVDPSRPRRGMHQEAVVNVITRTSPVYAEEKTFDPQFQKTVIKDLNVRFNELINEVKELKKLPEGIAGERAKQIGLPAGMQALSTLGIPDAQAGTFIDYRKGTLGAGVDNAADNFKEGIDHLQVLGGVSVKMYSDNLRSFAPFAEEFQHWGRNISSVTNAMASSSKEIGKLSGTPMGGRGTEFPSLRTGREKEVLAGGRYGTKGYGFNVLAELRQTAGTFEDQVLISGKLADALTTAVRTLVQPSAAGRVTLGESVVPEERAAIEGIREGLLKDSKSLQTAVGEISNVFQNVLGIPQRYKGRADKALVDEVKKVISIVRSEPVEVQQAKIAEVFLSHFGRKFTTRYGMKGVGVMAPGAAPSGAGNIQDILKSYGEAKIKILTPEEREKAGLGVAVMPKSMGEIAGEMIDDQIKKIVDEGAKGSGKEVKGLETLKKSLVTSGNKFMVDMFKQFSAEGIIPEKEVQYEAREQKILFDKFAKVYKELFSEDLISDIKGINALKDTYTKNMEGELYKEKPIDIRIRAAGIGGRGLQPEVLESVVSNIAGTGAGGQTTVKTELGKKSYEKLLGTSGKRGELANLSEALGFKKAGKWEGTGFKDISKESIQKSLEEKYVKEDASEEDIRKAVDQATRGASLEADSQFYVDIIDEFGEKRRSLVGEKFLQIIEEPHAYAEWSKQQIREGKKGIKLNLPAYSAYAHIFGEESKLIDEIKMSVSDSSQEHWEYIKAFMIGMGENEELRRAAITEALKEVKLEDIRSFDLHTGSFKPSEIDKLTGKEITPERSFVGTALDVKKFPAPFKVKIPKTKPTKEETRLGKDWEDLYVPGALARGTYPEPLIAGEYGPKGVARRIQILINAAKKAASLKEPGKMSEAFSDADIGQLPAKLMNSLKQVMQTPPEQATKKGVAEAEALSNALLNTIKQFEDFYAEDTGEKYVLADVYGGISPLEYIEKRLMSKVKREGVPAETDVAGQQKRAAFVLSDISEMLIGPSPQQRGEALTPEKKQKLSAKTIFDQLSKVEKAKLAITVDPGLQEKMLDQALNQLENAKLAYYDTLAQSVLGKTGSIGATVFSRRIEGVMGKAITAVVDKREELENFSSALKGIGTQFADIVDVGQLNDVIEKIGEIHREHRDKVTEQLKRGLPVLKQHEVGIPKGYAEKIAVTFAKKYKVLEDESGIPDIVADPQKAKESSLYDMLEYIEKLEWAMREQVKSVRSTGRQMASGGRPEDAASLVANIEASMGEYRDYIEKELVPYVEAVRFPFTGTSSVQPYKAKLLRKPKEAKYNLAEHVIAAPGVPEMDVPGFEKQINVLKSVREGAFGQREKLMLTPGGMTPDLENKFEKLTKLINELDKAISDVIPKYIAHQMKLDFDGDTLDIHSASLLEARREIKEHFQKQMHELGTSAKTTASVLRDQFTYGAVQPPTGEFILAEMSAAFEKKGFTPEKGQEFLRKPFLTQKLEYLKPAQQLDILSGLPGIAERAEVSDVAKFGEGASKPFTALEKVLETTDVSSDAMAKAIEDVKMSIEAGNTTSDSMLNAIKDASTRKVAVEGVRKGLFESKYEDAIEAQLYKIHTGQDVEAIMRLMRVAETHTGFGSGGLIGQSGQDYKYATPEFKQRWPEGLKLFGPEGPASEMSVILNEMQRFAQQKGIDVKHAGAAPIAQDILKALGRQEKDLEQLFKNIGVVAGVEGTGDFGELEDLYKANAKAIKTRLGEMTTPEIRGELKSLYQARGESTFGLGKMGRGELQEQVVETIGFKGVMRELQRIIQEEAKNGIMASLSGMEPSRRAGKLRGFGSEEEYASAQVLKAMKTAEGINISNLIVKPQQPFYPLRTFAATPKSVKETRERRGEEYTGRSEKFDRAKAVARQLEEAFQTARPREGGRQAGGYGEMVRSTMANVERQQEEFEALYTKGVESMSNVVPGLDKSSTTKQLKSMNKQIQVWEDMVGLPSMSIQEMYQTEQKATEQALSAAERAFGDVETSGMTAEQYDKTTEEFIQSYIEKARALERIDKIWEVLQYRVTEAGVYQAMFPKDIIHKPATKQIDRGIFGGTEAARSTSKGPISPKGGARIPGAGAPGGGDFLWEGGIVPVHIKSIEEGLVLVFGGEYTGKGSGGADDSAAIFNRKMAAIKEARGDAGIGDADPGGIYSSAKEPLSPKSRGGYGQYVKPKPIAEGRGLESVYENLKMFHESSKQYQQTANLLDYDLGARTMPDDITKMISEAREKGPKWQDFIEMGRKLKTEGDDTGNVMSGAQVMKAMKLYKMAEADFLMSQADEAKKALDEAEKSGNIVERNKAYGKLAMSVKQMQTFVRDKTLGKATDIYRDKGGYIEPDLAQGAGVYVSKEDLMKKSQGGLGEDPQLQQTFKMLTSDILEGGKLTAPITKIKKVFDVLSDQNDEMVEILLNADKLERVGVEFIDAWDFGNVVDKVSTLREELEKINKFRPEEMTAKQTQNLTNTIKFLKGIESSYAPYVTSPKRGLGEDEMGWGRMGTKRVPKTVDPSVQKAMHAANEKRVREYFKLSKAAEGPAQGERYQYTTKIFGDMGDVIQHRITDFHKLSDAINAAGEKVGVFSEKSRDMFHEKTKRSSFKEAMMRAVRWGAASKVVYGGAGYLKDSLDTIGDVEMGIAKLRMVMSPLETDFDMLEKSAVGFAKQYGVSITGVLDGMKIFAQQGLGQAEVIDRTRAATLAANVTTLNAKEATEALTAATKIYRTEGESVVGFLDAWSEVESRHAITAGDLANGLKKSAAAAKNAGIDFDQLNGMITAIGATTRQTGKEVGTSLRFIFRRLTSEKGPKALAEIGIPTTEGRKGVQELRSGFDILHDLAGAWDGLTSAQKMNVSQAIGGTRQYNQLLVLMDQWDEALMAINTSINSKGSAERRNIELMKTYQKQLAQTQQAANELKIEFGKIYLPLAKFGLKGMRGFLETLSAIPTSVKVAAVAITTLLTVLAKGGGMIDYVVESFRTGKEQIRAFAGDIKKGLKAGSFEAFGVGRQGADDDLWGLKQIGEGGNVLSDFHTGLGKSAFLITNLGRKYNAFIGPAIESGSSLGEALAKGLKETGKFIGIGAAAYSGLKGTGKAGKSVYTGVKGVATGGMSYADGKLAGTAAGRFKYAFSEKELVKKVLGKSVLSNLFKGALKATGIGFILSEVIGGGLYAAGEAIDTDRPKGMKGIKEQIRKRGLGSEALKGSIKEKGFIKGIAGKGKDITAVMGVAAGQSMEVAGEAAEELFQNTGKFGKLLQTQWAGAGADLKRSIGPLVVTMAALLPVGKVVYEQWKKVTGTAQEFEKAMYDIRREQESGLSNVKAISGQYTMLKRRLTDIRKLQALPPEELKRRKESETYEAPIVGLAKIQKDAIGVANSLADINSTLAVGYDNLGNAVLRTTDSFEKHLMTLEQSKIGAILKTDIEVIEKYISSLTELGGDEKWKVALKGVVEAMPVVGKKLGEQIEVGPAKAISVLSEKLNKLSFAQNKAPLTAAFAPEIKKQQELLKKAKTGFDETYKNFRATLGKLDFGKMTREEITKLLTSPDMQEGFKLIFDVEPEFKLLPKTEKQVRLWSTGQQFPKGHARDFSQLTKTVSYDTGAKWEDVMGAELMNRVQGLTKGFIRAHAELTKGVLETAGVKARDKNNRVIKAQIGDIVTFFDDVVYEYGMSAQQGILKLNDVDEWVVEYFNSRTLEIEERAFDKDIQKMVEQIFPVTAIIDDVQERMDHLNEFVAGAGAGLRGITPKDFKRDFNLGERFFSEIPTSTLIQSGQGFVPTTESFGQSPFQKTWKEDFENYFAKPMREYRRQAQQVEKLKLEGLEGVDVSVAKELADSLYELQDILKNNQVVLQFNAVFADLTKNFAEGTRVLKENLAVERARRELLKEPAGYLKGVSQSLLAEPNLGKQIYKDLTPHERALKENTRYVAAVARMQDTDIRRQAAMGRVELSQKSLVALDRIGETAKGLGASMSPEDLQKYTETVLATGDIGVAELKVETSKVAGNTADTVNRLDSLLANQGDLISIEREVAAAMTGPAGRGIGEAGNRALVDRMEDVARLREKYEKQGNVQAVAATEGALNKLTKELTQRVGFSRATELVGQNTTGFSGKRFTPEEYQQRTVALTGLNANQLIEELEKRGEAIPAFGTYKARKVSSEGTYRTLTGEKAFKDLGALNDLKDLQQQAGKTSVLDSKNLSSMGAFTIAWEQFEKSNRNKITDALQKQTTDLENQKVKAQEEGIDTSDIDKDLEATKVALAKAKKELDFHKTVQTMASLGTATVTLAKQFGLSESDIKALGAGALGTYGAYRTLSTVMNRDTIPEAKAVGAALKDIAKTKLAGKELSGSQKSNLKSALGKAEEKIKEKSAGVTGVTLKELKSKVTAIKELPSEEIEKMSKSIRASVESQNRINRWQQMIVALLAVWAANYVSSINESKTILATNKKRSAAESKLLSQIMENARVAADMEDIVAERMRTTGGGGGGVVTPAKTTEVSRVLDTEKRLADVKNKIREVEAKDREIISGTTDTDNKDIKEAAKILAGTTISTEMEKFQDSIEAIKSNVNVSKDMLKYDTALGLTRGVHKAVPIDQGMRLASELAPEQYMAKYGNADIIKKLEAYGRDLEILDAQRVRIGEMAVERDALLLRKKEGTKLSAFEGAKLSGLTDAIGDLEDDFEDLSDTVIDVANDFKLITDAIGRFQSQMNAVMTEMVATANFNLEAAFGGAAVTNKNLMGFGGELSTPIDVRDMSTQQFAFAKFIDKTGEFNSNIQIATRNQEAYGREVSRVKQAYAEPMVKLRAELAQAEQEVGFLEFFGDDVAKVDRLKESMRVLGEEEEKVTESLKRSQEAHREFIKIADSFMQVTGAVQNLRSALESLSIKETVDDITRASQDLMDQMLGGGHPGALQSVSLMERQRAREVGVALGPEATQYEKRRAELKKQMITADGMGLHRLRQEMAFLPAQEEADATTYNQKRENEKLRQQFGVYREYMSGLETAKRTEGLTTGEKEDIGKVQDLLAERMGRMMEKVGPYGNQEYRGIREGESQELREEISKVLSDISSRGEGSELKNFVENLSDPIVAELMDQTTLLKEMVKHTLPGWSDKDEAVGDILTAGRTDYLQKILGKAEGGSAVKMHPSNLITGPGTATSDSIPAYLSNKEFVTKAASVQKLGVSTMKQMNATGQIPLGAAVARVGEATGLAEGGEADKSLWDEMKQFAIYGFGKDKKKKKGTDIRREFETGLRATHDPDYRRKQMAAQGLAEGGEADKSLWDEMKQFAIYGFGKDEKKKGTDIRREFQTGLRATHDPDYRRKQMAAQGLAEGGDITRHPYLLDQDRERLRRDFLNEPSGSPFRRNKFGEDTRGNKLGDIRDFDPKRKMNTLADLIKDNKGDVLTKSDIKKASEAKHAKEKATHLEGIRKEYAGYAEKGKMVLGAQDVKEMLARMHGEPIVREAGKEQEFLRRPKTGRTRVFTNAGGAIKEVLPKDKRDIDKDLPVSYLSKIETEYDAWLKSGGSKESDVIKKHTRSLLEQDQYDALAGNKASAKKAYEEGMAGYGKEEAMPTMHQKMNRLMSDYSDYEGAQASIKRVNKYKGDVSDLDRAKTSFKRVNEYSDVMGLGSKDKPDWMAMAKSILAGPMGSDVKKEVARKYGLKYAAGGLVQALPPGVVNALVTLIKEEQKKVSAVIGIEEPGVLAPRGQKEVDTIKPESLEKGYIPRKIFPRDVEKPEIGRGKELEEIQLLLETEKGRKKFLDEEAGRVGKGEASALLGKVAKLPEVGAHKKDPKVQAWLKEWGPRSAYAVQYQRIMRGEQPGKGREYPEEYFKTKKSIVEQTTKSNEEYEKFIRESDWTTEKTAIRKDATPDVKMKSPSTEKLIKAYRDAVDLRDMRSMDPGGKVDSKYSRKEERQLNRHINKLRGYINIIEKGGNLFDLPADELNELMLMHKTKWAVEHIVASDVRVKKNIKKKYSDVLYPDKDLFSPGLDVLGMTAMGSYGMTPVPKVKKYLGKEYDPRTLLVMSRRDPDNIDPNLMVDVDKLIAAGKKDEARERVNNFLSNIKEVGDIKGSLFHHKQKGDEEKVQELLKELKKYLPSRQKEPYKDVSQSLSNLNKSGIKGGSFLQDLLESSGIFGQTQSNQVAHAGGRVVRSGPIFAAKGEYIVPQMLAEGGMTEPTTAVKETALSVNVPSSITLDVEDFTAAAKQLIDSLKGTELSVDPAYKVPIATTELTVTVDSTDAETRLATSITEAINASTVKTETTGAVGADEVDKINTTMDKIQSELVASVRGLNEEIEIIKATPIPDEEVIMREVDHKIKSDTFDTNQRLNDTETEVVNLRSVVGKQDQQAQAIRNLQVGLDRLKNLSNV